MTVNGQWKAVGGKGLCAVSLPALTADATERSQWLPGLQACLEQTCLYASYSHYMSTRVNSAMSSQFFCSPTLLWVGGWNK